MYAEEAYVDGRRDIAHDTWIGIDGPSPTDTVPNFVYDMFDDLVHLFCILVRQLLRQYHSKIPGPDGDYTELHAGREGVDLVQWDGDMLHVLAVLMGRGRWDAIRTLSPEAVLQLWTLEAIDLWDAIGPAHHDDLVGGLARSESSPGKLNETIPHQERTPSCRSNWTFLSSAAVFRVCLHSSNLRVSIGPVGGQFPQCVSPHIA